jgi:hypothetical protein
MMEKETYTKEEVEMLTEYLLEKIERLGKGIERLTSGNVSHNKASLLSGVDLARYTTEKWIKKNLDN